jgi:hypothetical protein
MLCLNEDSFPLFLSFLFLFQADSTLGLATKVDDPELKLKLIQGVTSNFEDFFVVVCLFFPLILFAFYRSDSPGTRNLAHLAGTALANAQEMIGRRPTALEREDMLGRQVALFFSFFHFVASSFFFFFSRSGYVQCSIARGLCIRLSTTCTRRSLSQGRLLPLLFTSLLFSSVFFCSLLFSSSLQFSSLLFLIRIPFSPPSKKGMDSLDSLAEMELSNASRIIAEAAESLKRQAALQKEKEAQQLALGFELSEVFFFVFLVLFFFYSDRLVFGFGFGYGNKIAFGNGRV